MRNLVLFVAGITILCSACTTFKVDEAVVRKDAIDVPGSPARTAMTVGNVHSSRDIRIKTDFKQALTRSLSNQDLLSGETAARYVVSVEILEWDTPGISDISYDRISTMVARYSLKSLVSEDTVWAETITTEFNAPRTLSSSRIEIEPGSARDRKLGFPMPGVRLAASGNQRLPIANAGAARTNIARFIEALRDYLGAQPA